PILLIFILVEWSISSNSFAQKRFITVVNTRICINTIGLETRKEGQPVIIFESGMGTPMDNWDRVLKDVSGLAPVVIIDPADFTETAENKRRCFEDIGLNSSAIDSLSNQKTKALIKPGQSEGEDLRLMRENDFKEINECKLPNIPVHILTGGRYDTPPELRSPTFNDSLLFRIKMKNRVERWARVVQSVDHGMLFYSADAGHFVHFDDPELLVSSIRIMLQDIRLHSEQDQRLGQ
ncbi:MAG: hypothetical protein PHY99_10420, partial [Bacteroidales bacterium]|nr:hypothetical protein [Bacteroidales bacterium]